jgi:hypothetical protein
MPGQRHWGMVLYYLICGSVDAAIEWFASAIDQRDLMTVIQIRSPLAAPMRSHPRWTQLAKVMNLPPQGREK